MPCLKPIIITGSKNWSVDIMSDHLSISEKLILFMGICSLLNERWEMKENLICKPCPVYMSFCPFWVLTNCLSPQGELFLISGPAKIFYFCFFVHSWSMAENALQMQAPFLCVCLYTCNSARLLIIWMCKVFVALVVTKKLYYKFS